MVLAQCQALFPDHSFALKIIKTTGDKLQTASLAQEGQNLPKGLFTKELEVALLNREADLAVHSLKDLPTELPGGLKLGAVTQRADVRDVLIYRSGPVQGPGAAPTGQGRGFPPHLRVQGLPENAVVATSSTRRRAQLLTARPGLQSPDIRGNVATRLQKLATKPELDATVLALAGMSRLKYRVTPEGKIEGDGLPAGLLGTVLDLETMLPCVGQGAIGIEVRENDPFIASLCEKLNHQETFQCVTAERAFLAAMGGGCQSPVAAYAEMAGGHLRMRAISFAHGPVRRGEATRPAQAAVELGQLLAAELKG
jgi:hydroxymethylbilane synthase